MKVDTKTLVYFAYFHSIVLCGVMSWDKIKQTSRNHFALIRQ